ncbi:MAG TPA: MerR family transcriptional regulator [Candidatus Limnocylindrales bacterium]|nr:MerR family transcriptional regulator [Candidatus Limnocylindrales bacterium]
MTALPADFPAEHPRLLRIHEAADAVGLTPRAIRYYEQLGLLTPPARSDGAYRLFSEEDMELLRRIKSLRDDAGFSLAEIQTLLVDDAALLEARSAYRATGDPARRRALVLGALDRVERRIGLLRGKVDGLVAMIGEAEARRAKLRETLAMLDADVNEATVTQEAR